MVTQPSDRSSFPSFFVLVSFFGLIMISLVTLNAPLLKEDLAWRRPFIGLLFASVCVLGILAVFFPNECSRKFDSGARPNRSRFDGFRRVAAISNSGTCDVLLGHHPTCGQFSSHIFGVGGKVFCATCSGLFLGAILALGGVVVFILGNWQIGSSSIVLVSIGTMDVAIGLFQSILLNFRRSFVRITSGAFLPLGAYLILSGVDQLANDIFLDVFVVLLSVFWLFTRISLSHWEHEKMCSECNLDCDAFEHDKKMGA